VMRVPTSSPTLATLRGIALSESEEAEALADNLETDPSAPTVIELVDVALRSYLMTPQANPS